MGRGFNRQKKLLKHQYNDKLYKDYQRILEENKQLKEDPNGVVAPFLERFNAVVLQNNRLSALAASLLDQLGGKAEVTKEKIESFKGFKLLIKIETPEGVENFDNADRYIFTYELQKDETPTILPSEPQECNDPNCTLPKDLKHTHTVEPEPPMHEEIEPVVLTSDPSVATPDSEGNENQALAV